jgi:hypothetical protein
MKYKMRLYRGNHELPKRLKVLKLYRQAYLSYLIVPQAFLTLPLYCFSRVYLVVDSFLQLAHLPDAVYQVTNWSQYFPHII